MSISNLTCIDSPSDSQFSIISLTLVLFFTILCPSLFFPKENILAILGQLISGYSYLTGVMLNILTPMEILHNNIRYRGFNNRLIKPSLSKLALEFSLSDFY